MTKKNVLITGGKGNLAGPVAARLAGRAHLMLTDLAPPGADDGDHYRQADLADFKQVVSLMEGVEVVVHLAVSASRHFSGRPAPAPLELDPYHESMVRVNPLITYHVFEAARRAGVRRVVYASSLTIYYGDKSRDHYLETDCPDPQNLYACTKLFGENLAAVYGRDYGIEALSLRIGQPFPAHPGLDLKWRHDRRARSSYVTLEDVARSVEAAVFTAETTGVYNVVSDSDNPRFDLSASRRMGYVPSGRFAAEGLFHRENESGEWTLVSPTSQPSQESSSGQRA